MQITYQETGETVDFGKRTYIIIVGPTWIEECPSKDDYPQYKREINTSSLEWHEVQGYYKFEKHCNFCFTWYLGGLKLLPKEEFHHFMSDLQSAKNNLIRKNMERIQNFEQLENLISKS